MMLEANADVVVTNSDEQILHSSLPNAPPLPLRL
jgi:hypothetical protein